MTQNCHACRRPLLWVHDRLICCWANCTGGPTFDPPALPEAGRRGAATAANGAASRPGTVRTSDPHPTRPPDLSITTREATR